MPLAPATLPPRSLPWPEAADALRWESEVGLQRLIAGGVAADAASDVQGRTDVACRSDLLKLKLFSGCLPNEGAASPWVSCEEDKEPSKEVEP